MTALGVFAEEADVDLEADTLVIDSVADWIAVSEESATNTDNDFADKVISIEADITFTEAAPVLFAGTFAGKFYGNGHIISGTTLAGANLIAATVSGGTISGDDAEESGKVMTITGFEETVPSKDVKNVAFVAGIIQDGAKVKNDCTLDSTQSGSAGILVSTAQNSAAEMDTRISNCKVEDCTFTVKSQGAAILGNIGDTKSAYIVVENCIVTGTTTITGAARTVSSAAAALGAVVGKTNDKAYLKVDGCTVGENVSVTSQNNRNWGFAIGMIVGQAGTSNNTGALIITNCNAAGCLTSSANKYSGTSGNATDGTTFTISVGGIVGSIGVNGNNVISNCTSKVTFDASAGALTLGQILGSYRGAGSGTMTISNCTATVALNISKGNLTVGGILGNHQSTGTSGLTISKCNVTGEIIDTHKTAGGAPRQGGILGRSQGDTTGNTVIEQCYVNANISAGAKQGRIGGIVGHWAIVSTAVTIRNTYYEGTVSTTCTATTSDVENNASAIIGNKEGDVKAATDTTVGTVANISNVVLNATVSINGTASNKITSKDFATVENCYTMNSNISNAGFVEITNVDITAASLMKKDANGFIESVRGYVNANLVQVAGNDDGTYTVRFIGTSIFDDVTAATMSVLVGETSFASGSATAYDILEAYGESDAISQIAPETYGAEKFFAIIVKGIPAENLADVVFTVNLSVTSGGNTYDTTFNGSIPSAALS